MCCWVDLRPAERTIRRLVTVNETYGDGLGPGRVSLPPIASRDILRSKLRELRVYVEFVTEKMDYVKPRNHRTLEVEYRRLRRQLHQKADDSVYRRFREPEDESSQTRQPWVDLRSGSELILQTHHKRKGEEKTAKPGNVSKRLVVKGRDLYRSAENIVKKERLRFARNDFGQNRNREPTLDEPFTLTPKVSSPQRGEGANTKRIDPSKNSKACPVVSTDDTQSMSRRYHSADDVRDSKSNSKGHRVRFAPEVRYTSASSIRSLSSTANRTKKQKLNISITSISSNYWYLDEPRFLYTTRAMALMPVSPMG